MTLVRCRITTFLCIACAGLLVGCKKNDSTPEPSTADTTTHAPTAQGDLKASESTEKKPKRVFIVQSYEADNVCGMPQGEGILKELKKKYGDSLIVETHYMDTKTINSTKEAMKKDAQKVIAKIEKFKADVVFTVDDNAFREVGLHFAGKEFPIVFSGMNAQPEKYNSKVSFLDDKGIPNSNITGVYEKLHVVSSLSVLKGLMPDLKKVVALLDQSPTGNAIELQLQRELKVNDTGIEFDIRRVGTLDEYLQQIEEINADPSTGAVYNVVLSIKKENGESVGMKTTFREFLEKSTKPAIALNFAFCKLGLFGGASVDFVDMGENAGRMGIALLEGEDIQNYPIYVPDKYLITFNHACAEKLGITLTDDILSVAILFDDMPLLKQ